MGGSTKVPATTTNTTTVKNQLPPEVSPYLSPTLSQGWNLQNQPYQPYPGMTLAPLTPEQLTAMSVGTQRAISGSQVGNAAQQQATQTLQGGYFDNPYLADAIRLAQGEAAPNIGYAAGASGSFGNSGLNEAAARTYGDIATKMRFANYDAERGRQMQMTQLAPELANMDYQDLQMLMGFGDARRAYQQQLLDEAAGKYAEAQQWPYQQMDWWSNILRGIGYGTGTGSSTSSGQSTQPNPYQQNQMANFIGGGMALGGLYDVLKKMG